MDIRGLLQNPLVQIGANMLAASRPGVPTGQAIGQGLLGAQQQMQLQSEQEELQNYRRSQSEYQQGLLEQKRQMMQQQMRTPGKPYKVQQGGEVVYLRDLPGGGTEVVGRGPMWNPSRAPQVSIDMGGLMGDLQTPIDRIEARQLRNEARELENLVVASDRLMHFIKENPGSAGVIAQGQKVLGSLVAQVGDFLSLEYMSEAGESLSGNLALYKTRTQAFINASRAILMAGERNLSDKDRGRLESATQGLEAATTDREVFNVARDVRDLAVERAAVLGISIGGGEHYTDPDTPPPE